MATLFGPLIAHFLYSLALGTASFSWIADPKLTGAGFIRLVTGHGAIFLALNFLLALIFGWSLPGLHWGLGILLFFLLAAQWLLQKDERSPTLMILAGLQWSLAPALVMQAQNLFESVFLLSSFLFLGVTHYAMLLGHYYLVVPKLTERPLLVSLKIFWALGALKFAVAVFGTYLGFDFLRAGTSLGDGYLFNSLIVSMRWLWGYLALAILSYFAWRLCRMRSIQSATGVLYIMVFFVFIGELLSMYLFFKHGLTI